MTSPSTRRWGRGGVAAACFALVAAPLTLVPAAQANTAGTGLVISEVYGAGGNSGAVWNRDYIELYNAGDTDVSLSSYSVQYRSATGLSDPTGVIALSGSIKAKGYYLVGAKSASASVGAPVPTPNASSTTVDLAGSNGTVFLASQKTPLDAPATGPSSGHPANPAIVDLVGYGTSNTFEGTTTGQAAPAGSATKSVTRNVTTNADTDVNSADFAQSDGSPTAGPAGPPPPAPVSKTIEEIQGSGFSSPLEGTNVTTRGVVTAAYPNGGLHGLYLQTEGTGGAFDLDSHTVSDGVFVDMGENTAPADYPTLGAFVEVTGIVAESFGLTTIQPASPSAVTAASGLFTAPRAASLVWPGGNAKRESLEGMLVDPAGDYTVTDNYSLNNYGEIGLARGTQPLRQSTDVARPGAGAQAVDAANATKAVLLDDGAATNYLSGTARNQPLPYLSTTNPIRVGSAVDFTKPVVVDYQFGKYRFQPTSQVTGPSNSTSPATFSNTRTAAPEAVGGDLKIASFNVLNYFTDTGDGIDKDADSVLDCTSYKDRQNNPVTVNGTNGAEPACDARGAWNDANRQRQQAKIVTAINALGADVLSLEEIENSAKFDHPRDASLTTLLDALNADAGSPVWAAAPSPAYRPALADEDVIRTAFIYKRAKVETVGASKILTGSSAFGNAREPLAQVFRPLGGKLNQQFLAVVNHFKSKSSGTGTDADMGDGQGGSNASRVAQAKALVSFVKDTQGATNTKQVFLTGDFNSYTKEDPMQVLYDAGYTDVGSTFTDESTYLFGGVVGSLDHVLTNSAALRQVTGADVWNINSVESPAFEYSRRNYNVTDFYQANQYRSSDHDPLVVGFDTPAANKDVTVNLLNINDFHGRIDANTVGWAATIEKLRQDAGDDDVSTLGSAGDNIGASLFASSSDGDIPTIKVLNKLGLQSSVGNHEFDKGYADLVGRVADATDWDYLGANVYRANGERALDAYDVVKVNGVKVGVIGAVTQETPSLVTPSGIDGLQFKEPVAEVNKVADQLTDNDTSNGEADIVVAEYHEGAPEGTSDGATLDKELAASPVFASIVNKTSPKVAAIFTGHTHKAYAWDAQVPGAATGVTRPVMQTGSYGDNIGRVTLTVDSGTLKVSSYTSGLTPRLTAVDGNKDGRVDATEQGTFDDSVVAAYGQRVADVRAIVTGALDKANIAGAPKVGQIGHDITTAYAAGKRDDRTSESTLGNTVANMLRDTMATPQYGSAEIGVVNPGGLRAELLYAGTGTPSTDTDGVVTKGEAVSVLPFANNLFTVRLTGAQFKQVLEQQWQRNADGTVPSRSFLHLGLSDNVVTTLDPTQPEGSRVTSVTVNGVPLDAARTYTIGTFSFLATGGDNFRAFRLGTSTDTGLVDTDGWFDYLGKHQTPPLEPSFARRQVFGTGIPASIKAGQAVSFTLSRLDLTSLGSTPNATVDVVLKDGTSSTPVGSPAPVTGGTADVSFTAPASIPAGSVFVVTARPSGTAITIPATVTAAPAKSTTTTATVSPSRIVVRATKPVVTATVEATDGTPAAGGTVDVYVDGANRGTAAVSNGTAQVRMPAFTTTGSKRVVVQYTGVTGTTNDSSTSRTITVVKAKPSVRTAVGPRTIHRKRTHPKLTITLTAPGQTVTGYIAVRAQDRRVALVRLVAGKARVTLPTYRSKGLKSVVVRYLGSSLAYEATRTVRFRVVK